jgi:hypothetical protein
MRTVTTTAFLSAAVVSAACGGEPSNREPAAPLASPAPAVARSPPTSVASAPAGTAPPLAPLPITPGCSPDAEWNGSRCTPKKVDCAVGTTWNGGWCLDPAVERAAATHFARIDAEIHGQFAPDGAGYEYAGFVGDIVGTTSASGQKTLGRYQQDSAAAVRFEVELAKVIKGYPSPNWKATAVARQGTLYDELWTSLKNAAPPRVALFTPTQEALLRRLPQPPGPPSLQNQSADLRASVTAGWEDKKSAMLAEASRTAISRYAVAVALARFYVVTNPGVTHAEDRLAEFTAVLGAEKMREHVTHTPDPTDASGRTMLTYTAGMYRRPAGP